MNNYIVYINPNGAPEILDGNKFAMEHIIIRSIFLHLYIKLKHVDIATYSELIRDYMTLSYYD